MVIKEIGCENFLSFKELKLKISGVKRIQGENLDDDGQETNGTGKSAIHSMIEAIWFNTTSRKNVSLKQLVRWGHKNSYLYMIMYCPMRKEELLIERTIGKISKLDLSINSEPVDFATIADGNSQIIKWIGINKEDLQNFFLINKEKYNSFYSNSNTSKLSMIGRFSNLSIIDGSDEVVKEECDSIRDLISEKEKLIYSYTGKISQLEELILEEKNKDFQKEYNDKLLHYTRSVSSTEDSISEHTKTITQLKHSIPSINVELKQINEEIDSYKSKIDLTIIPDVNEELSTVDNSIDKIKANIKKENLGLIEDNSNLTYVKSEEDKCNNNLRGIIECPKCEHEFNPADPKINISEEKEFLENQILTLKSSVEKLIKDKQDKILKLNNEIHGLNSTVKSSITKKVTEAEKELNSLNRLKNSSYKKFDTANNKLDKINRNILNSEDSIKICESRLSDINGNIKNLNIGSIDLESIKRKEKSISLNEDLIKNQDSDLEKLNEFLFKASQWIYNFKLFRSELSVDVLNIISAYTNKFLESLKTDLMVKWEGFKVKSNGDLSDKITPLIIRNGDMYPFGSFSGGERGRLEYANILTSQYLINSTHKYGGLQFLLTDEITEGIDALGLSNLADALKGIGIPILLITHVMDRSISDDVLLIRKHNGESKIVTNDNTRD